MARVNYDKVFTGVVGKIGVFKINENIKNAKVTSPGEHFGKQFNIDNTHTIAVKIADITDKWITLYHTKIDDGREELWRFKLNGDWESIYSGCEIFCKWGMNGAYPKIDVESLTIIKNGTRPDKVYMVGGGIAGENNGGGGNGGGGGGFNPQGAINGNAFNCACECHGYDYGAAGFVETAMKAVAFNAELKATFADAAGPAIGMALINGCKATKNIDNAKAWATGALAGPIAIIEAGGPQTPADPAPQEPAPTPTPQTNEVPDDDIPF
ncbi:MAG: hypothetical protein GY799_20945 [Desulfobulbaceae bacterium]|nr:hypothetical protein [Desulfobulbaceae bacterium]